MLRILLERPGEIVSREELRTRLWPDGTFVDFDHSLNASVNKLREALGDVASNARFIETVPRRGYRFIAPVEQPKRAPLSESVSAPSPVQHSHSKSMIIAAIAALALGAGSVALWRSGEAPREPAPSSRPLTSTPGIELQPSFSPDGNYVAYTGGLPGSSTADVYIKQIGSETVRRLTSNPRPDVSPKWSPDGRHVAFVRMLGDGDGAASAVLIAPPLGGAERKVADTRTAQRDLLLDWFPDSESLVFVDNCSRDYGCSLFGVNTRTGERWKITTPPQVGQGDLDPAVSSDGRQLAFARHLGTEQRSDIYLVDLDVRHRSVGEPRALTTGSVSRAPVWMPNGREILFATGPLHRKRLARLNPGAPSTPQSVPFVVEGTLGLSAAVSPRGQLVYPTFQADVDIHRTEVGPNGTGIRSERFLGSTFVEHLPEYSPDGNTVAFVSNRSGSQQIWLSQRDGSNAYQLTFFPENLETTWPRWSPDGRRLFFAVGTSPHTILVQGGHPEERLKNLATAGVADWSRDGKWIYFVSNHTGRDEIWKIPDTSPDNAAGMVQVTRNGGGPPRTSPDGKFIYYTKGRLQSELWRVPADGGSEARVIDNITNNGSFALTRDGAYFVPSRDEIEGNWLMFQDFRTGRRRNVAPIEGPQLWGLAVSPDGRTILHVTIRNAGESDLMLVENFR